MRTSFHVQFVRTRAIHDLTAPPESPRRLAQQPNAVAATNPADRSRWIRSTADTADRAGGIGSTADTADRAGGIGSTADTANRPRRVTGANAANRSRWIGSSSTWHEGFSFVIIQALGAFR
jgi:hypothetical protein